MHATHAHVQCTSIRVFTYIYIHTCAYAYVSGFRAIEMCSRAVGSQARVIHVCSVMRCVAVLCSVLQCVAVCYSVLQCIAVSW